MTRTNKAKVLVTGATGMQGGASIQALLRAGHSVTAFVRAPAAAKAQALAEQGVALATGDLDDVASLRAAAEGHDAVFSVQLFGADFADLGSESRQARNIATAAKQAGVRQIVHTSVSAAGWRAAHPEYEVGELITTYWDEKEAAEDAVRQAGFDVWTILRPAFFMDNFLSPKMEAQFPDLLRGELVTATSPDTELALTNTDDFGAAVAAAVTDPKGFNRAVIELAGDALTHPQIAEIMSNAAGRHVTSVSLSREEAEKRFGTPSADSWGWNDYVGYPARPHHAAQYGLSTSTFEQWAARQDWSLPNT